MTEGSEKKKEKKLYIKIWLLILIGTVALGIEVYQIFVWPLTDSFTYELGQAVSEEPADYLFARDWRLKKAVVDLSQVDQKKAGTYTATVNLNRSSYDFTINIIDTTAPDLVLNSGAYFAQDRSYTADGVVEITYDLSGEVETGFIVDNIERKDITLSKLGAQNVTVYAKDSFGNRTVKKALVTVDTAPVFIADWDLYLKRGEKFEDQDFLGQVIALDDVDGNLTDEITVDYSSVDLAKAGDYPITYSVTDQYGLETDSEVTFHIIEDADEYAAAKETAAERHLLTATQKKRLFAADYFTYEPLEEEDQEKAESLVEPSLICMKFDNEQAYGFGSGAICRIDEDYVYFLSVNHVADKMKDGCTITFYDGYTIAESFNYVEDTDTNELVLFRIPTLDIPDEELINLKQVAYSVDIYDDIYVGENIFGYAANWCLEKDVIKAGTISETQCSSYMNIADNCIESKDTSFISGMSGTAVCDFKGNLVGLVSNAHWEQATGTLDFSVRYDDIEEMYDRLDEAEAEAQ